MNRTPFGITLLAAAIATGCAPATYSPTKAQVPELLSGREEGRIADSVIRRDLGTIESFQQRIKVLNDGGVPVRDYHLAKAQCWVSFALEEYHENDRTGVIEAALTEADSILDVMQGGGRPAAAPPKQIATAAKIRDDLWAKIEGFKGAEGFRCATQETACLEVKLNEAGHDYNETGWRHARFNIDEAERMAADAQHLIDSCPSPHSEVAAVHDGDDDHDGVLNSVDHCPNTPMGDRVDNVGCSLGPEIRLQGVNFATASDQLLPESFPILNDAVATLRRYPDLRLEVAGHTDSRGADAYNENLSQRRATAVQKYLADNGVTNSLGARGYGEREPVADNNTDAGRLANRRVVLKILN
jgi:OmpA-OmpF porin, OOP family